MKALGISNEKIETEIENEKGLFPRIIVMCCHIGFITLDVL